MNLLAGIMTGLHGWAFTFVVQELKKVIALCEREKIGLIFLGMPQNRSSMVGSHLCTWMNKKLLAEFADSKVHYIDIHSVRDRRGQQIFFADGIHFSEAGHIFLKEKLLQPICNLIDKKVGLQPI